MDREHINNENSIVINFNKEKCELDKKYIKPFSRSKSVIQLTNYNSKTLKKKEFNNNFDLLENKNNNNDLTDSLVLKKQILENKRCFQELKTKFYDSLLVKNLFEKEDILQLFSFVEKQNALIQVIKSLLT